MHSSPTPLWRRSAAAAVLGLALLHPGPLLAADLLFSLDFEDGLKTAGANPLAIQEHGGGAPYRDPSGNGWLFEGNGALEAPVPSRKVLSFLADESFTLEVKIRLTRRAAGAVLSKGAGGNYRLSVDAKGIVGLSYYSRGKWRSVSTAGSPLPVDEWVRVTAQFDAEAATLSILLDGRLAAKEAVEAPLQSNDEAPLYIGGTFDPATAEARGIQGALDDVRVYGGVKYPAAAHAEVGATVFDPAGNNP